MGYPGLEVSLARLAGILGAPPAAEFSAAQLVSQVQAWVDEGSPGAGGSVVVQRHRVVYADYVPHSNPVNGCTAPFFTLPAFSYIIAAAVVVIEAFDDSTAFDVGLVDFPGDTGVLTYRLMTDGVTPDFGGFFHLYNHTINNSLEANTGGGVVTYTEQQLMAILDNWAQDGTTGIADMWIAYAVAEEV